VAKNFHEQYAAGHAPMPSERSTGLVFAGVSVVVAYLWRANPVISIAAMSAAAVLLVLSLTLPNTLRPLNLVWFRLGLVLHRVVNPLVMLLIFVVVFLPAGLIFRIWNDPLKARRAPPGSTYWIECSKRAGSMSNQF
jgi:hypothetical protein